MGDPTARLSLRLHHRGCYEEEKLKTRCGRQGEFIPSLAEGNLHASCVRPKIDGTVCQAILLFMIPALYLFLAGSGRLTSGMGFKPNEFGRKRALCVSRAFSGSVVAEPTPQMGRKPAVVGAVRTQKEVANPAIREIVRKGPSAHDVRSGQAFLIGKLGAGDRS